jgi:hypothetical protein
MNLPQSLKRRTPRPGQTTLSSPDIGKKERDEKERKSEHMESSESKCGMGTMDILRWCNLYDENI